MTFLLEQRLRLFLQICDAVGVCDGNFVVHRDLKPGNILVDREGTPKLTRLRHLELLVFDGGVATETISHGLRMLTPDYASPEQSAVSPSPQRPTSGSLGAILFELLTDSKPQSTPETLHRRPWSNRLARRPFSVPARSASSRQGHAAALSFMAIWITSRRS